VPEKRRMRGRPNVLALSSGLPLLPDPPESGYPGVEFHRLGDANGNPGVISFGSPGVSVCHDKSNRFGFDIGGICVGGSLAS
jgi:hypothetical protein